MAEDQPHIRVLFPRDWPAVVDQCHRFPVFKPSANCPWPGFCSEIIAVIAKSLDMAIEPVLMDDQGYRVVYGENLDDNWTGVLGAIQRGEVDTACLLYQKSYVREKTFNFTEQVYMTQTSLAVRRRDAVTRGMWEIFQPYSAPLWASMGLSLVIHILLCICIARTEVALKLRRSFEPLEILGQLTLFVFAVTQCLLLLGLYQTYILSAVLSPPDPKPFATGNDLMEGFVTNKFRFVSYYSGHWFWDQTLRSPVSGLQSTTVANGMGQWPIANVSSVVEALDLVNAGNYVLVAQEDDNAVARLSVEKSVRYCDILFISEGLPEMSAHFVFRKGNPLINKFNEAIQREEISIMRIVRRYFANAQAEREQMCGRAKDAQKAHQARPLGLTPYLGLILVVGVGGLMAVLAFFVEISALTRNQSNVKESKLFAGGTRRDRRGSV